MDRCWATCLGGCGKALTKEHLVSKSILPAPSVEVMGFPYCEATTKQIGTNSLVSHILCKTHNNALSELDTAAMTATATVKEAFRLAEVRAAGKARRWHVVRTTIPRPHLLERWCLKTAINMVVALPNLLQNHPADTAYIPPAWMVRVAFGLERLRWPMGLYTMFGTRGRMPVETIVGLAPLADATGNLVGAQFAFHGLPLMLHLQHTPLDVVSVTAEPGTPSASNPFLGWIEPDYHVRRWQWQIGHRLSHLIDIKWPRSERDGETPLTIGVTSNRVPPIPKKAEQ